MLNWLIRKISESIVRDAELNARYSTITQMGNGTITVNGKRYKGDSVMVIDNTVYIDGVLQLEERMR